MKEMILLTKEEYNGLLAEIGMRGAAKESEEWQKNNALRWLDKAIARAEHLWDELNRPAIESAAQKHEDEFLDWCEEKSAEYERKEFDDWATKRARFYNNGRFEFCKTHHIGESEYDLYIKYDGWHPVVTEVETEGWTSFWAAHWHTDSLLWWAAQEYTSGGRWDWDTYTLWLNQSYEALALGYEQH